MKKKQSRNAARGTRATPFRLGNESLAHADRIAAAIGAGRNRAAAVRYALAVVAKSLENAAKNGDEK